MADQKLPAPWWACLSWLLFTGIQFNRALYFPPMSDDAWMATVARNFGLGYGWASSHGEFLLFDPQITTGPGLLGFVALAIRLFGNQPWVPHVAALTLNLLLFAVLAWRLSRQLERMVFLRMMALLPLLYGSIAAHLWMVNLGDVAAFLYVALAVLLVQEGTEQTGNRYHLLAAGILAGLAILTKLVAVILLSGLVLWPLLHAVLLPGAPSSPRMMAVLRQWGWLVAGVAIALLPWKIYEHITLAGLSPEMFRLHELTDRHVFLRTGSGLEPLIAAWQGGDGLHYVLQNTAYNVSAYTQLLALEFRPLPWLLPAFVVAVAILLVRALLRCRLPQERLLLAFLLPLAAYLPWLLCFSGVRFGRFLYMGLFLGLIGLVMVASRYRWLARSLGGVLLLSLLLLPPIDSFFGGLVYLPHALPSPMTRGLERVASILGRDYRDETLVGCTNIFSHEVAYILPRPGQIVDCEYWLGRELQFDHEAFLQRYPDIAARPGMDRWEALRAYIADKDAKPQGGLIAPVTWQHLGGFIVVGNPQARYLRNFGLSREYNAIIQDCHDTLYDDGQFSLLRCTAGEIEAPIRRNGGISFYPPQWLAELWAHDAQTGRF